MNPDLVNSLFPFIGCIFTIFSIKILINDKQIKGISLTSTLFFYIGQMWSIYFMFTLKQWYSFFGGVSLFLLNTIWFVLAIYYRIKNNEKNI